MELSVQLIWVCGLFALVSIPLALGIVPPNGIYGFRTRATLGDPSLWYRANRFAGLTLLAASVISAYLLLAAPSIQPIVALVAPVLLALVACFVYLRRAA